MMSPSAGNVQRLTTVLTSRWFIAIMIPLPGIRDILDARHRRDLAGPRARCVDREAGLISTLLAAASVAHARR